MFRRVAAILLLVSLASLVGTACLPAPTPLPIPLPSPTTTAAPAPVLSPGSGSSNPQPFIDAYNRIGGVERIGTATNAVHGWNEGCTQDFSGGWSGKAAIMQPSCTGSAYYVVYKQWAYIEARWGGSATAVIGYPTGDDFRWGSGWSQHFAGGTQGNTTLTRADNDGVVRQVWGGIRHYWVNFHGGASGALGYPTSEEYSWNGVQRQDFQGGSILWDPVNKARLYQPTPPPPPPPPGRPPASAQNIGYNPYAANYSNQCTYYAEQRMANQTGMYMPVYGHAYQFASQASAGGWTVGTTPLPNSVAVFPAGSFGSSVGHVGWVVQVSGSQVRIQDYNWGFIGAVVTDHWVTIPAGSRFIYSDR